MSPLLIGPDEGEWAYPLLPEVLLPVEGSQVSIQAELGAFESRLKGVIS